MNRHEFLGKLWQGLQSLPTQEVNETLTYYDELLADHIEDGASEEEAVASLGDINEIIATILRDRNIPKSRRKSGNLFADIAASVTDFVNMAGSAFERTQSEDEEKGGEEKALHFAEGLQRVEIDLSLASIQIKKSPDSQTHLRYRENPNNPLHISEHDGVLRISKEQKNRIHIGWDLSGLKSMHFQLELPDGIRLQMDGNVGKIQMEGLTLKDLDYQFNNGLLKLVHCSIDNNLMVDTSNAKIDARDLQLLGNVRLRGTNGLLTLQNIRAANVDASSSNGLIQFENLHVSGGISAKTTNGSITMTNIEFGTRLHMESVNANLKASLPGKEEDYSIHTGSKNGRCNVQGKERPGAREIQTETTNGSIHLEFSKKA